MRFFFYGTLIDPDVRRHVLGPLAPAAVEAATLDGWRRRALKGVTFPLIEPAPGAQVDGVLARGLTAEAGALLDEYEGPGYRTRKLAVTGANGKTLEALVYVADGSGTLVPVPGEWRYEEWRRRHKKSFLAALATQRFAPR